jgi:hypothetical protein
VKVLRNRRLVVGLAALALVGTIGAVGALSPRANSGMSEASSQQKARASVQRDAAAPLAYTVGGIGGLPASRPGAATAGTGEARAATPTARASNTAPIAPSAAAGPRIVKTGTVDVEVRKRQFGPSFARLTTIATSLGGFVSSSKTFESGDIPNGTVTLRVPSDRFDELVRQVRALGKVRAVSSSGEDVTGQITDVRARLKALEAQRDQYLALLGKAGSISDTLAVRDRLGQVQVEIEQLQGQLKLLDDQTAFGTLAVSVAEPGLGPVGPQAEASGWAKAWDDAVGGFVRGSQAIVAHSGATLLVLLCAAALAVFGRAGYRWISPRLPGDLAQEA